MKKGVKIFIVGSCPDEVRGHEREKFQEFCQNIGKWLVSEHHVLLCGASEGYADFDIFQGMHEEWLRNQSILKKPLRVKLFKTRGDETEKNPSFYETIKSLHESGKGPLIWSSKETVSALETDDDRRNEYRVAVITALEESDVLMMIGGGAVSRYVYTEALKRKRPIIIFSKFGGTSRTALTEYQLVYETFDVKVPDLADVGSPEHGRKSLNEFINEFIKTHPHSKKKFVNFQKKLLALTVVSFLISASSFLFSLSEYRIDGLLRGTVFMLMTCCSSAVSGSLVSLLGKTGSSEAGSLFLTVSRGINIGFLVFIMSIFPLLAISMKSNGNFIEINEFLTCALIFSSLVWSLVISSEKPITGEYLASIATSISKLLKLG